MRSIIAIIPHRINARPADDVIVTVPPAKDIVTIATVELIVAIATLNDVGPRHT